MQIVCQGERQTFWLTSLGWTQVRNVYMIYVGQDIRALEQQLANQADPNADDNASRPEGRRGAECTA